MNAVRRPLVLASLAALYLCASVPAALAQDDFERGRARPQAEATPAVSTPAAARVTAGVGPLVRPAHIKEIDAAPGSDSPKRPVPAAAQSSPIALVGGTLHTVSGPDLPGATLLMQNGKIAGIGRDVELPPNTRRIDVAGLHIYPSLMAANTPYGLVEIGAVRATRDLAEVGDINPNARAEVAVNPDSLIIPVTRSNGILVAMTAPQGGLIAGTGAVIELDGWTWEDMTLKAPAALMINWPGMSLDYRSDATTPLEKQTQQRNDRIEKLREAFRTARAYAEGHDASGTGIPVKDRDVKWDATIKAVRREIPVVVSAGSLLEIRAALAFAEEQKLRLILDGGRDTWQVADELARRKVPVLVSDTLALGREWEPYDVNFTLPLKLSQAGVEFAISYGPDASNSRNLPYVAAKAASYGLAQDEALKAITLYPARILGIADRLGSLEVGKDATLFVSSGDPLDERSNVERAFIRGKELDLADHHKLLYERFRRKPRLGQN